MPKTVALGVFGVGLGMGREGEHPTLGTVSVTPAVLKALRLVSDAPCASSQAPDEAALADPDSGAAGDGRPAGAGAYERGDTHAPAGVDI